MKSPREREQAKIKKKPRNSLEFRGFTFQLAVGSAILNTSHNCRQLHSHRFCSPNRKTAIDAYAAAVFAPAYSLCTALHSAALSLRSVAACCLVSAPVSAPCNSQRKACEPHAAVRATGDSAATYAKPRPCHRPSPLSSMRQKEILLFRHRTPRNISVYSIPILFDSNSL